MKTDFNSDPARTRGGGLTLDLLPEGAPARIVAIHANHDDLHRLEVMGVCPGRTVEVAQAGDPMIVRVLGTRIGLAAAVARAVSVSPHRPA